MAKNVKELLKRTRQRRKAEITLSTGDVIELYFMPLTEAEDEKIREAVENDKRNNAYGLRVLVNKAEYADGSKMFTVGDIGMMRNEYAKGDLTAMMEALVFNGGVLAKEDPKSDQGSDQE
jgi:hypothetical protein